MKVQPLARQSSLIVKEVDDETLIYDRDTDKAHCLNLTAARIWKSCDGQSTVSEIAERLGAEMQTPVDENVVWMALDQLEKFKLLDEPVAKPAWMTNVSRRRVVRTLGIAAIVAPIITSIVVPVAAQGGPQIPPGSGFCCVNPSDCACPPTNTNCCEQTPRGDPPCSVYPPNPQNAGKQCNF
jgi:hypothetical protein